MIYCDEECKLKHSDFHRGECKIAYRKHMRENKMLMEDGEDEIEFGKPVKLNQGLIGLSNIGNTCYMNSALQCIFHTDFIKNFFLNYDFDDEINYKNPLGTKGVLIKEFKNLVRKYFTTRSHKINPSSFKITMTRFLTTFEGYAQHDSQEFLSQLLDSFHEDLNRIIHKPYTENITGNIGDDEELIGRKSWINFLQRNYSYFVENFYGQFKSLVVCPDCHNSSLTFDPFQLISLSIPMVTKQSFDFYFLSEDHNEKAIKFSFDATSWRNFTDITLSEIQGKFCKILKKNPDSMYFAALGFSIIGEVCEATDTLSKFFELKNRRRSKPKIFLCELNKHEKQIRMNQKHVPVYLKTNHDVFDVDDAEKSSFKFFKKSKEYSEDPIFTKVVFTLPTMKAKDLYILTLRKFLHVTSLEKSINYRQKKS